MALAVLTVAVTCIVCFNMCFYEPRNKKNQSAQAILPPGELYKPFRELTRRWAEEVRAMDCEECYIKSFDGLCLYGRYFEYQKGAPIEIMFHGYRGSSDRDLAGGVRRAFALGHSVMLIDQRTSGKSEGKIISFGINESRDCRSWVDFCIEHFGKDVQLILTGISMGAATVLIAAGRELPPNVVGVLADCGYTSAKDIIQKTIRDMKLPPKVLYPFVRLTAKIICKFDLEEDSPLEAMERCVLPVFFIHGDVDDYVPWEMSQRNFETCQSRKAFVTIRGAGHGLAYPVSPEEYVAEMKKFFYPQ
jgi:fermentation-respiration switch protein FrsA (DUF1100 family)